MTKARRAQISLVDTPYYHCISRCVRRAFLCGEDHATGRNFDHRRAWIRERLALLVEVFAIDLCAYAIMSNHYHLVLRVNTAQAEAWGDREVVEEFGNSGKFGTGKFGTVRHEIRDSHKLRALLLQIQRFHDFTAGLAG